MGVHSKLWDETTKFFGSAHINKAENRIVAPTRYPSKPLLSIIDGSGKIYKFTGGTTPIPFSQFIEPLTEGIREILRSDPTNSLVVLMDREAPKAKRANAARYSRHTPIETPASQNLDKIEVWREYVYKYWMPASDIDSLLNDIHRRTLPGRFDWLVPPYTATVESTSTYKDYLDNPHFKLFFQEECCRYWAENVEVGPTQWMAIMGSHNFFHFSRGSRTTIPKTIFDFSYCEADPIIGYLIRIFTSHNINVISDDGDVVIVALLVQHHLVEQGEAGQYTSVERTKFSRQCNVVNKWLPNKRSLVYYDIETLWRSINYTIIQAWQVSKLDIEGYPIMLFAIAAALNGNDYVRHFPQLSPRFYFQTLLSHAHLFAELTSPWEWGLQGPIRLNCSAIVEMVLRAYKLKFPSLQLSADVERILADIKRLSGKRNVDLSLADLRTRLGNLCYYLTYFLDAQYARPPPSEFCMNANGFSLYGYTATAKQGKIDITYTDVPELDHIELYH